MSTFRKLFGALRSSANQPRPPQDGTDAARVAVTVGSKQIDGWLDYEILNSMVEPCDGFQLSRPFDRDAWKLCELDQEVKVSINGTQVLDGFIDDKGRRAKDGVMEISGRDKAGRLVQESIPTVSGLDGLQLTEAAKRIASPWFTTISLSDARNRNVRRGKGHRASAGNEPAFFKVTGKLDEENSGKVDPGETRWNVLEQLCSSIGVLCWSSADGRELVIGQPNYNQAPQYLFRHSYAENSTVLDMSYRESVRDAFAMIEVHGSGSTEDDEAYTCIGIAKDGPNTDGTGRDFLHPKRLVIPQSALASNAEAQRAAEREKKRRGFDRRQLTVNAPFHGQVVAGTIMTLFAPNTIARCIDEDLEMDELWLIYAARLRGNRAGGQTTELMLVPRGTEFVA